ncbi:MAG TPA: hypothetical protein PKC72_06775 [Chitinophagaceae bacterium]|nr:hypothetical protein [Chitinophagaceae bacterium]
MKKIKHSVKRAGVWLDQETAFIVWLTEEGDTLLKKISSSVESRVRIPGERKVFARFGNTFIDDQEKKQRRQKGQREKFYKKIISLLEDPDELLIFGPGRAKFGLRNSIEKDESFGGRILDVKPADKMTSKNIRSFVADFYGLTKPRLFERRIRKLGAEGKWSR